MQFLKREIEISFKFLQIQNSYSQSQNVVKRKLLN